MISWNRLYNCNEDDELPEPADAEEECNPYYLIYTKCGASLAMYIVDEEGQCAWYKDYISKLATKVIAWSPINTP